MVKELPSIQKDPFPNGYIRASVEDKLFKHVLFHTDKNPSKLRIRSIGHDWTETMASTTGELEIPLTKWDFTKDKFRMKAVLSEPDYGVLESDWVSQQVLGDVEKRKLNQFRVRGITKIGMRSRWIYSELKDEDNNLVVFQLLHDLLDVMTIIHEHDLDIVLEAFADDLLIGLMNGGQMDDVDWIKTLDLDDEMKYKLSESIKATGMGVHQFDLLKKAGITEESFNELMRRYIEFKEQKKAKIEETVQVITKRFKKNFMEQKKFSSEEIAEHALLFKFKDIKMEKILEQMIESLILITLDDAYERTIEECHFEALLHNDEELLLLLNDVYEFKAKSILSELFVSGKFVDNFVTFFGDGLSLFIESGFDEAKIHKIKEDVIPVLLLMYRDAFIPMALLDTAMTEVFANLIDDASIGLYDNLKTVLDTVRFEYYDESTGETWTLVEDFLFEIFEYLLLTDVINDVQVDIDLFSKMIGSLKTDALKLFIMYDPVEAVQFVTQIIENIRINAKSMNGISVEQFTAQLKENANVNIKSISDKKTEQYNLYLADKLHTQELTKQGSIEDTLKLKEKEDVLFVDSCTLIKNGEIYTLRNNEKYTLVNLTNFKKILENYALLLKEGYTIKDIFSNQDIFLEYNLSVLSDVKNEDTKKYIHFMVSHYIAILQTFILQHTVDVSALDNEIPAYAVYHLELLYRQNPTDVFSGPFMRHKNPEDFETAVMFPTFYRYDDYFNRIWNIKEDIHVFLGDLSTLNSEFSLGRFVLGRNTLVGETI